MKIKELLDKEIDIDVYDDVTETLGIAFCGPAKLTKTGEKYFAAALDLDVELFDDHAIVHVDGQEGVWQKNFEAASEFFHAAAGYCAESSYNEWFDHS